MRGIDSLDQGSAHCNPQVNPGLTCSCKQSFSGTQIPSSIHILSMAAFRPQWRSRAVATETVWPTKPKVCIMWQNIYCFAGIFALTGLNYSWFYKYRLIVYYILDFISIDWYTSIEIHINKRKTIAMTRYFASSELRCYFFPAFLYCLSFLIHHSSHPLRPFQGFSYSFILHLPLSPSLRSPFLETFIHNYPQN